MKLVDVNFPHPVLGIGDAINSNIGLIPKPEIIPEENLYRVKANCDQNNEDLLKLINDGKAEYFCEVTCSGTFYRETFKSKIRTIECKIPRNRVKGKVEFTYLLVATSPIPNYQNTNIHPDYNDFKFDLEQGDILAYFGSFHFDADINYLKLKAVSSFMELIGNPEIEYTNIDLAKNKILIELPLDDLKVFEKDRIAKKEELVPIFHSSIVLNALLIALYNINQYKGKSWAKALEYRLKNEKELNNLSIEDPENIPEIAQRLLGNPFNRLIHGVDNIIQTEEFMNE